MKARTQQPAGNHRVRLSIAFLLLCVRRSSSSPGPPAPCLHSRTEASTPSPGFTRGGGGATLDETTSIYTHAYIPICCSHTHSQRGSCGRPAAAGVGRESSEWVPRASCRQTGHWPYPSPTLRRPCSPRFPSSRTESCGEMHRASTQALFIWLIVMFKVSKLHLFHCCVSFDLFTVSF